MRRPSGAVRASIALLCLLVGCGGIGKLDLGASGRARWQRPEEVVATLGIAPGDRVADVGTGDGYFVPYLADAVGESGTVYAVEVDEELIANLEERFGADKSHVVVMLGEFADPKLPDAGVDLVILVNTYHHIEDRPAYFARLREDLDAGGRVAILEPNEELGGLLSLFLDEGHTSIGAVVVREMGEAGYTLEAEHEFLPVQIFQVYAPRDTTGP